MLEVRRLRQARAWNQTELAFHARLAPSVISEIENGKRDPSARTLRKLAEALKVDVADLFPKVQSELPLEDSTPHRPSGIGNPLCGLVGVPEGAGSNEDLREWLRQLQLRAIPAEELSDEDLADLRRLAAGGKPQARFVDDSTGAEITEDEFRRIVQRQLDNTPRLEVDGSGWHSVALEALAIEDGIFRIKVPEIEGSEDMQRR